MPTQRKHPTKRKKGEASSNAALGGVRSEGISAEWLEEAYSHLAATQAEQSKDIDAFAKGEAAAAATEPEKNAVPEAASVQEPGSVAEEKSEQSAEPGLFESPASDFALEGEPPAPPRFILIKDPNSDSKKSGTNEAAKTSTAAKKRPSVAKKSAVRTRPVISEALSPAEEPVDPVAAMGDEAPFEGSTRGFSARESRPLASEQGAAATPRKSARPRKSVSRPEATSAAGDIAEARAERARESAAKKQKRAEEFAKVKKTLGKVFIGAIIAALIVGLLLVWNALWRYDDSEDIQGQWRTSDWTATVIIDSEQIRFPKHVSWDYELTQWNRTLEFTFTDLTGEATYEFSSDRNTLTIRQESDGTETETVLVRMSDDTTADPELLDGEPVVSEEASEDASSEEATGEESDDSESDDAEAEAAAE